MDDTVAMQDTNSPALHAPASEKGANNSMDNSNSSACTAPAVAPGLAPLPELAPPQQQLQQPARTSLEGSRPECSPKAPQSPSMLAQQVSRGREAGVVGGCLNCT